MRRPTELRLRNAFADILHAVVATTALTACSGSSSSDVNGGGSSSGTSGGSSSGHVQTEFTSLCGADGNKSLLQGMSTSPPTDGAEQRYEQAFPILTSQYGQGGVVKQDDGNDAWTATNNETVGALCSKASDPNACRAKVASFRVLPPDRDACATQYGTGPNSYNGNAMSCSASYILYTSGDEIGVARNKGEIAGLLGTVDTLTEALWFATQAGYQKSCSGGTGPGSLPQSQYRTTTDGGWDFTLVTSDCGKEIYEVTVHVDPGGNVTELSRTDTGQAQGCAVAGRRPDGLSLAMMRSSGGNMIGEHFAAMAALEAASVVAFRRLHRDLVRLGAPQELVDRVREAARDEIRHARATSALARKYGVTPKRPDIAPETERTAFEIALENAREGCVRETYGALVAHLQKERAHDADVRATMNAIADEETQHAALSWDIATWVESTLTADQRDALAGERRAAFALLASELAAEVDPRVCDATGVPSSREALEMLTRLEPHLAA